jgi:hypothetical protein
MPDPRGNTQASRTTALRLPGPDLEVCVGLLWAGRISGACPVFRLRVFPVLAGGAAAPAMPGGEFGPAGVPDGCPAGTPDAQDGRRTCRP